MMQNVMTRLRKTDLKYYHYLILFCYSFLCLLVCTKSSPLFFLNDWVDANAYFTMGKGMIHGLVPFRDLFEQKGPFLYFIHAIAYLISHKTFLGVYIFESIGMGISLVFFYKICNFYMKKWQSLWASFLLPAFLVAKPAFKLGDSAEEFSVPFMMGLIYLVFAMDREEERDWKWMFFIQGISLACVFWMKYTLIGAWIGFYMVVFFEYLIKKQWKKLRDLVLWSLAGFAAATLPWILYFGYHRALGDLFDVYFVFNMTSYPPEGSLPYRILQAILIIVSSFKDYWILFAVLFLGMGGVIFVSDFIKRTASRAILCASFFFTGLAAFYGGKTYVYYYQVFYPFMCIGLVLLLRMMMKERKPLKVCSSLVMSAMAAAFSFFLMLSFNQTIREMRFNTSHPTVQITEEGEQGTGRPAQYVFADIMNQIENPTMLNYGKIDMGFYTVADILPINRYFEKPNISYSIYPDIMDEQDAMIRNKEVDFVVMRLGLVTEKDKKSKKTKEKAETIDKEILKNYEIVATHNQKVEHRECTYYLLQKKE